MGFGFIVQCSFISSLAVLASLTSLLNSWRPSSISLKVFLMVDWAFSSFSTLPSNLLNLLSRLDTAELIISTFLSIVSSLARMRSTFDSKLSGLSTTSSSHLLNAQARSLGLKKSLLLFSPLVNYQRYWVTAFPGFSFSIHTNCKPKIIAQKQNVEERQKTHLLTLHTSTQSSKTTW